MRIEYTVPPDDNMAIEIRLPDGTLANDAAVQYVPEPVVGMKVVAVGRFRATGNSGRVEEADVVFDLKKGTFVILPKRLHAAGFDFDKPPEEDNAEPSEVVKRGGPDIPDSPVQRR